MKNAGTKIIIENGVFKKIPQKVREFGERFAVVTDTHLRSLGSELLQKMRSTGLKTSLLIIGAGEASKSLQTYEKLVSALLKLGFKRDGCVIALGGGVVGDLAGFVASTYMRGISLVHVPTTLLAMCDSSLGGKTGVDLPEGKNLLGSFYTAQATIIDPLLLKTLPERDFRSGMAEVIKHGIIAKKSFFEFLEKSAAAILKRSPSVLKKMISESVAIKMAVVKKDPYENFASERTARKQSSAKFKKSSRMLLNYGHTVGHALEKLSDYTLKHGDAVSIGMVAENRIAVGKNILKQRDADHIERVLRRYNLPVTIPARFSPGEIKKTLSMDKKNIGGKLYFALPRAIGKAMVVSFDSL